MSKTLLIASLIAGTAACRLATAAPQAVTDAPGVTVTLNGAPVLHRTGVVYPPEALRGRVQGSVSAQVTLDSTGTVSDAQVLSGPDELRKAVLQSVLYWHFAQQVAGTTRVIQIAFELPDTGGAAPPTAPPPATVQQGSIRSIRVQGLSEQARTQLLASLPVHEGDVWNAESAQMANQAVKGFDEHFVIRQSSMTQSNGGAVQVDLVIAEGSQIIKVGGNVEGAMILRKTPPVYPAAAKAAHIQGEVHLSAIIGPDGTVQQVTVLSGPAELVQAATDAVKQWVYRPTLLNNSPVQVETTIDVNFTLNQ